MPSTYTNNLGIQKPANGEQSGTWGDTVNVNSDILDVGINGVLTLSLTGTTTTLTTSDGVVSNGQYKALVLAGSPSGTNTITISPNDAQKIYYVYNTTAQTVVFTQGSGGNVTLLTGDSTIIYANGAGATAAVVSLADHLAMSSARITGGSITGITDLAVADGGTGASDAATARTNLGLVIGTNVQAYDAGLQSISGLVTAADRMIYTTALDTYAVTTLTSYARTLLDDADAATARTTLGLGSIATQASSAVSITGGSITGITDLAVADGGTGASTLTGIVKGNGTAAFTAAVAGTDYLAPAAIGVTVQAYDAGLQSIAGLVTAADRTIYTTALDTYAVTTLTAFGRSLMDDADAAAGRATLGAQASLGFTPVQQGGGTTMGTNKVYVGWDASGYGLRAQVDSTALGRVVLNGSTGSTSSLSATMTAPGDAPLYACRAWVNFNGQGTVAIRGSGNVSSITDNGTGDYTVNFTTAMQDANYATVVGGNNAQTNNGYIVVSDNTASAVRVMSRNDSSFSDGSIINVAIFR